MAKHAVIKSVSYKVRTSHAANNGRIFSWNNAPEVGHPGEDYNCRCYAEPYVQGQSEFANQVVISAESDNSYRWTDIDFSLHFYLGEGRGLSLSQTGHLSGIMNYYFYTLGRYNAVNTQIVEEARRHEGEFGYHFDGSYRFGSYFSTCYGKFSNAVNFRGEPHVPGMDKMLSTTVTANDLQQA